MALRRTLAETCFTGTKVRILLTLARHPEGVSYTQLAREAFGTYNVEKVTGILNYHLKSLMGRGLVAKHSNHYTLTGLGTVMTMPLEQVGKLGELWKTLEHCWRHVKAMEDHLRKTGLGGGTCRTALLKLIEQGFFETPRPLAEIREQLPDFDKTAVNHALLELVKDGVLTRIGSPRYYKYLSSRSG
jgi:DNA-binding HxlR family transcriptional regulator